MTNHLEQAIKDKTAIIGIIGLGYVGLPLIDAFVNTGFKTLGFDVDQNKVDQLQAGKSYIQHIPSATVASWRNIRRLVVNMRSDHAATKSQEAQLR